MPRYCIVENGIVVNVVEAPEHEANFPGRENWVQSDIADSTSANREAWRYDGENFIEPPPPVRKPKTPRQRKRDELKQNPGLSITAQDLMDLGVI